jgi:hypothetical protein
LEAVPSHKRIQKINHQISTIKRPDKKARQKHRAFFICTAGGLAGLTEIVTNVETRCKVIYNYIVVPRLYVFDSLKFAGQRLALQKQISLL